MSTLNAISLFTGAGGLDYGFEAAGFRTAVALEFDHRCCTTIRRNRPHWPVIEEDLCRVSTKEILSSAGLRPPQVDVLIGGPPCQPFSKAGFWATGEAKRLHDPRANTLEAYLRVLAEIRPKAFLLENVEGIGFKGKDEGLSLIQTRLEAINALYGTKYRAAMATLNAADYGVPQIRRRLFVIGNRDGAVFNFPAPTHGEGAGRSRSMTAWDALHDLPEPMDSETDLRGKWADLLPSIPEGQNYLWHTDRGGGHSLFGWRRRYWCFLLKLAKDQPSWTLQAQPGPATGPFHWNNRRLTSKEMARLQTFPEDVKVGGNLADAQRQLGNAVPSLLAEILAREIAAQFFSRPASRSTPLLSLRTAPVPPPAASPPSAVPAKYERYMGEHEAHPGTGKGARAVAQARAA